MLPYVLLGGGGLAAALGAGSFGLAAAVAWQHTHRKENPPPGISAGEQTDALNQLNTAFLALQVSGGIFLLGGVAALGVGAGWVILE